MIMFRLKGVNVQPRACRRWTLKGGKRRIISDGSLSSDESCEVCSLLYTLAGGHEHTSVHQHSTGHLQRNELDVTDLTPRYFTFKQRMYIVLHFGG